MKASLLTRFFILGLFCLLGQWSLGQENRPDTDTVLQKASEKLIGVWRMDLPEQKQKMEPADRNQLDQLDEKEQEDFWMMNDSKVYILDKDGTVKRVWVDRGSYFEENGKWDFQSNPMTLVLQFEEAAEEYKVNFTGKGMVWVPRTRTREFFGVLHLKSLLQ
jgi:hypothetical protein